MPLENYEGKGYGKLGWDGKHASIDRRRGLLISKELLLFPNKHFILYIVSQYLRNITEIELNKPLDSGLEMIKQ